MFAVCGCGTLQSMLQAPLSGEVLSPTLQALWLSLVSFAELVSVEAPAWRGISAPAGAAVVCGQAEADCRPLHTPPSVAQLRLHHSNGTNTIWAGSSSLVSIWFTLQELPCVPPCVIGLAGLNYYTAPSHASL